MPPVRRSSRRKASWNGNQICLAIICVVFALLILGIVVTTSGGPGGFTRAFAAAFCPAVFGVIPALMLWMSRRRSGRRRSRKGMRTSSGVSGAQYRDVTIFSGQELPRVCIRCGKATKRVSPFRYGANHTDVSPYDWNRVNPILFVFLVWKYSVHLIVTKIWISIERRLKRYQATRDAVVFEIPHCKACASANPIVQRHFDFHGQSMIVEAHESFRALLPEASKLGMVVSRPVSKAVRLRQSAGD